METSDKKSSDISSPKKLSSIGFSELSRVGMFQVSPDSAFCVYTPKRKPKAISKAESVSISKAEAVPKTELKRKPKSQAQVLEDRQDTSTGTNNTGISPTNLEPQTKASGCTVM